MKRGSKLRSSTLWITIWACSIITIALVLHLELAWLPALMPILGLVISAYIAGNKMFDYRHGNETEDNKKDK
jgi:hypothetical protein